VFPGSGGTIRVTRRIGEGRAKEMMFFGEPIDAQTALAWGLVNRVAPPGEALITACRMADELARRPNRALQICKRAIDLAFDLSEDAAIQETLPLSEEVFASADCKEGVRAFFEKRPPRFTHS
jgi:enoyl-CoA hydratase/carnithine racemase